MTTAESLFVVWRAPPGDGTRHVVGVLSGPEPFRFRYRGALQEAVKGGFPGFPEFPLTDACYESPRLFATFRQRIPSARRPDYERLLSSWGLDASDSPLTVLAKSGGFLLTDRIELAEYRSADDPLVAPLCFRVAGQRYYDDRDAELPLGLDVDMRHEPDNAWDPDAVEILGDGRKLGYVPRQYSRLFTTHLAAGATIKGRTVGRVLVPGEASRWLVEAARTEG